MRKTRSRAAMVASEKLWGGRFQKPTDPLVERYTSSILVDYRLARFDIVGSIVHAQMLGRCSIITAAESRRLVSGLKRILRSIHKGEWKPDPKSEDIHTQMQQELDNLIGPVAGKLHTARSRNDQVSLDLRLYCREAVIRLLALVRGNQRALVAFAKRSGESIIPGYTHLQRGQPVLVAHHLLAYVEMLERDSQRIKEVLTRIQVLPLGAGALAGSSLPIDRKFVARALGFKHIAQNSIDAVSDRDFAVELTWILALLAVHLSRLAEDFILWATEEFGILSIDDAFATGSSLMPQKKNPDVLELVRGQAGLVIGHLTGFLTMLKGLPLSYNRDLQWDKRFVFESLEATQQALGVLERMVGTLRLRSERLTRLLETDTLCATDLAEYLVAHRVAFAQAHRTVGRLVAAAERAERKLSDFSLEEFKRFSSAFEADVLKVCNPARSVARKQSLGSTNPRQVKQALARWQRRLRVK